MLHQKFATALIIAALSAAAPAAAQHDAADQPATDISGEWVFETGWYDVGGEAQLRGNMTLTPREDGGLECEFSAAEYYRGQDEPTASARQVCRLNITDNILTIKSTVVWSSTSWAPDDFTLTIINDRLMRGRADSWMELGDVIFTRQETPIS